MLRCFDWFKSQKYFSYILDQNDTSIIVYNENNVSKYRTGTDYSEIYTGMKIYEAGTVVYTLPNNGYYQNGIRYKVKYDESSQKIRYYINDSHKIFLRFSTS